MRKSSKVFLFFIQVNFLIFNSACTHSSSSESFYSDKQKKAEEEEYYSALRNVEAEKYEDALKSFDHFIQMRTTSSFYPLALYNSALVLQILGKWDEASQRLRKTNQLFASKNQALFAESLYQLGVCFENMGQDERAIAAYLDSYKRSKFLSEIVGKIEVPARLAAAYARLGYEAEAQQYYEQADQTLRRLERGFKKKDVPRSFSKTLFNMGKMTLKTLTIQDFNDGLKPLEKSQIWLLRAIEWNDLTWSKKASEELLQAYQQSWDLLSNTPLSSNDDKIAAFKEQQEKMKSMAATLLHLLSRLKIERLPEVPFNKILDETWINLDELEKKIKVVLEARPVEQGVTSDFIERDRLQKEGKIIDPEGSLEKNQLKDSGSKNKRKSLGPNKKKPSKKD